MAVSTPSKKDKGYHHGDLRNALITAAQTLVAERGTDNFAMIDAARLAGVSSAAPYRHFKDKDELLEAVMDAGFHQLFESISIAANEHPKGSMQRILTLGAHYVEYVIDHPALFELMWGERGAKAMEKPYWQPCTSNNGYWFLVTNVADWCEKEGLADADPNEIATQLWATALGLASLSINRQLDFVLPNADPKTMLVSSSRSFLEGLKLANQN